MGVVIDIPEAGIDYVLYGDKSHIVGNYLYNQLQQIPQVFNEISSRINRIITDSYNFINNQLTKYSILNQITNNGLNVVDNPFAELLSFKQLQEANLTMQRWVMAHPQLRDLYLQQNIDGYSDTYVNISGDSIGDKDYNYRRVMDGVLTSDNDHWRVSYYLDDLYPGDKELDHYQKTKILNTWSAIDWILDNCRFDFTNKSDEAVKINKE